MEPRIAPGDMVVYNLASAPFGTSDKSALDALSRLSRKYPGSNRIRRSLAKKMREMCMFDAAAEMYFRLLVRTRRRDDAVGLLVCSLGTQTFDLYFLGMELHKTVVPGAPFLERTVAALEPRVFEVDHERLIGMYPFVGAEHGIEYGDVFHGLYTKCMALIQQRRCGEALGILMTMFKTASLHETIEFLVRGERVELLHYLAQQSAFFEKYCRAAKVSINKKLLNVFGLMVESQSEEMVLEFCQALKHKSMHRLQ